MTEGKETLTGKKKKRIESKDSKRYLYTHVHSNVIHKSPKVDAIRVSIDREMNKQNVI